MSKLFRKKPVVIQAVQFLPDNAAAIDELFDWVDEIGVRVVPNGETELDIHTLEDGHDGRAKHVATAGDWIIRGVAGEVYACKPGIFAATYERVEEK